jgi:vitamin D3 1,25-hydroxylase
VSTTLELFDGAFWRDPYPAYAELRADAPVRRLERADGVVWLLSRYADVRAALADPRLSKDWRYTLPPDERAAHAGDSIPMMILMDPPGHTRLRKLVSRVFTLRRMEALRPRVREVAAELIAALPTHGQVDLMPAYALLLPVLVICELLGVPADDRGDFVGWSNRMIDGAADESNAAATDLHGYLSALIEAKRARPDGALISALIEDADDDRLSHDELVAMAMMLLVAGHETTVNLVGNGLLALLTHPDQHELLLAHPELLPAAVEEFLRWESPVHSTPARFAAQDVEYAGVTIPAGAVVILSLAAANRDPDRFPGAEQLRVDREPAGHTAFGHGLHHCLGAQLARIEGQEAVGALLVARPGMALAVDPADLAYRHSTLIRGLRALPVRW